MPANAPSQATIIEALTLLGAPEDALAAFPTHPDNLAFSFADALVAAPAAIYTDWRFHPGEVLNEVWQRLFPHGVKGMIDEVDEETSFPKKIILQHAGIGSRYRFRIKGEEPCLHDILFGLATVLPAELQVRSLAPYDGTDSYLHIIQPALGLARVRELLGPWFDEVLSVHASSLKFTKTGGDVKPKRNVIKNYLKNAKKWLVNMEASHRQAIDNIESVLERRKGVERMQWLYRDLAPPQLEVKIQEHLAELATSRRFRLLTPDMTMVALRIIQQGTIDVLESRPDGWKRIHLALQYELLSLHIDREMAGIHAIDQIHDHGGRLLALAWTLGDFDVVHWLSKELIRCPTNFAGWTLTPLEPMLLQLYALWQKIDIDWANYPTANLGVYRQLFDAWNAPERLPAALEMCCDYHLMRTGESGYQEFNWEPYNIFPVEILAVHRLRELQGLPTPTIAHPLMDSPLGFFQRRYIVRRTNCCKRSSIPQCARLRILSKPFASPYDSGGGLFDHTPTCDE